MKAFKVKTADGFTIIETLIVLAIAGLILLIVFEAIPALERSSRNSQRRQDVGAVLEAVSHYELNNSGNFPNLCGDASGDLCSASTSDPLHYTSLTYYDDTQAGNVEIIPQTTVPDQSNTAADISNALTLDQLRVYNYEKCATDDSGNAVVQGAGYNDVVALFASETGSGSLPQCEQL